MSWTLIQGLKPTKVKVEMKQNNLNMFEKAY